MRVIFLVATAAGVLGQSLLLLHAHCAAADGWLRRDFRVVAFLDRGGDEVRRTVAEEKLRAIEGTSAVRFISTADSLEELSQDPDLARSVAFLGENPLPGAVEVELDEHGLGRLADWMRDAETIPELGDIEYKPLQARAILQMRFYRGLLSLSLTLAAGAVLFAFSSFLWMRRERGAWDGSAARGAACAGVGTAGGMCLVALLAMPLQRRDALRAWPPAAAQAGLLLAGAAAGWMIQERAKG